MALAAIRDTQKCYLEQFNGSVLPGSYLRIGALGSTEDRHSGVYRYLGQLRSHNELSPAEQHDIVDILTSLAKECGAVLGNPIAAKICTANAIRVDWDFCFRVRSLSSVRPWICFYNFFR